MFVGTDGPEAGPRSGSPAPAPPRRRRRWPLIALAGLVVVSVVVAVVLIVANRGNEPRPETGTDNRTSPSTAWLSGASGDGVDDGSFADWRGQPVGIAGTWADNNTDMVALGMLRPGGQFADWDKPLDIAIGAIGPGESWEDAAQGAYDDRWTQSLTNLRDLWGSRSGTLYIRFAHELNGNWYPWSVNSGNYRAFIEAWKRFRGLQQEIFPESKLVFSLTRESVGNGMDWRKAFPGAKYVDVIGVDYYNNPVIRTAKDWQAAALQTDSYGAPMGIERFAQFARSVGLPLAVPEWSGWASNGDYPAFIDGMHSFLESHAGTGPGQVLYDILFNVIHQDDANFSLFGTTRMPHSAAEYKRLW